MPKKLPGLLIIILALALAIAAGGASAQGINETAALASMRSLAQAEDMAALDTTYYVSLETLNDLPLADGGSLNHEFDAINDEGGTYVIQLNQGAFRAGRFNLLTGLNRWRGPYVNYQAVQLTAQPYDVGSPLDPWGNPFLFFTPRGLVRGDRGAVTLEYYGDYFDRYTIVSMGSNGVIDGDPSGPHAGGDDLKYEFGGGVTGPFASSLREAAVTAGGSPPVTVKSLLPKEDGVFVARAGAAVTVWGMGLGSNQGAGHVWLDALRVDDVAAWTSRAVTFVLPPELPAGPIAVSIETGGGQRTNALMLRLAANAAGDWQAYE